MEPTASLSILALLLLGLSQAVPLTEPQHVDITAAILTTNMGSSELLVERGKIPIVHTQGPGTLWPVPTTTASGRSPGLGPSAGTGCVYRAFVQHELNHALGFYHEQTRSDRDRYVRINWENISPTMQYNFNRENTNNLNTPYDYSSVMHYGKTAFSINGLDTITPIPDASVQIGQRVDLSANDILRINTLYKC
ncbi:hypothetical protein NFI96_006153 [Prochilodus magdalenae]|nr:hypothetical protein NFI96_006153 [Prochilodus magdalenae]